MTQPSRILVPSDFSAASEHALRVAYLLASRLGWAVDVLFVWEPSTVVPIETLLSEVGTGTPRSLGEIGRREAARRMTEFLTTAERPSHIAVSTRVEVGRADELIVAVAEQDSHDLVVMGSHGRSGLRRALMGSVAERVVRTAPCPVLTIRAPGADG